MTKVLAINGSYRDDGVTDKAVDLLIQGLLAEGAEVEYIHLRDYPIEFCLNCRECTQHAGEAPGKCVLDDGLNELVEKIEQADSYIFASPTNFGSVTALYKRFMERLVVYGYWPWGAKFPVFRKAKIKHKKKAVLVSSSAAPGFMGRWFFSTIGQLKKSATTVGAETSGVLFTGFVAKNPDQELPKKTEAEIKHLVGKLI